MAAAIYYCGGDVGDLPICYAADGWMSVADFLAWLGQKREIFLVQTELMMTASRFVDELKLNSNVLVVEGPTELTYTFRGRWPTFLDPEHPHLWWNKNRRTLRGLLLNTLSRHWNVAINQILDASEFSVDPTDPTRKERYIWREIGSGTGRTIDEAVEIIRKPSAGRQRNRSSRLRPAHSRAK